MTSEIESIKAVLMKRREEVKFGDGDFLSTGSTLLNLACSGRVDGGFVKGHYFFIVGDSTSGKTFLSLTCLAEAAINPAFDDYRFIYDGVEQGALMDVRRFFGKAVRDRMESPDVSEDGHPIFSETVEDFYFHVDDWLKEGKPFIYILDSQDSLTSKVEKSKFVEAKKAARRGKEAVGSYGDAKAKVHSANIRRLITPLKESGSILLVLNQTRDSFDMFERSTYSGGRSLKFYSTLQLWSSVAGKIERTVKGKKRQLGVRCKVKVRKNRITGRERTVVVPILHASGIDDIGGCVNYLVDEGVWQKSGQKITVTGMGPKWWGTFEHIVGTIEENGMESDLRELVGQTWEGIEEASKLKRKKRY